jgi:hypothetical protein
MTTLPDREKILSLHIATGTIPIPTSPTYERVTVLHSPPWDLTRVPWGYRAVHGDTTIEITGVPVVTVLGPEPPIPAATRGDREAIRSEAIEAGIARDRARATGGRP